MTGSALPLQWSNYEGVSPLGIVWRIARTHRLLRSDLVKWLKLTQPSDSWPRHLLNNSRVRETLAKNDYPGLNSPEKAWEPAEWWPFSGDSNRLCWLDRPRLCLECARGGYHTMAFQSPIFDRCPWHDTQLARRCPRCSAAFLDCQFGIASWGQCRCGFDLADDTLLITGDRVNRSSFESFARADRERCEKSFLIIPDRYRPPDFDEIRCLAKGSMTPQTRGIAKLKRIAIAATTPRQSELLRHVEFLGDEQQLFRALPSEWSSDVTRVFNQWNLRLSNLKLTACTRKKVLSYTVLPDRSSDFLVSLSLSSAVFSTAQRLVVILEAIRNKPLYPTSDYHVLEHLSAHDDFSQVTLRALKVVVLEGISEAIWRSVRRHLPLNLYNDSEFALPGAASSVLLEIDRQGRACATVSWTSLPEAYANRLF
ncbi:hypothetical protein DFR29_121108 [Tahibacter aquaticus]|uniref:TniQ protein n=1 Tax=Tahibacter aquaticus TaxID=520092 RepID=A0A4V3DL97_9GAMM|nr:hypothetical protein [Tahibacter aquaticus]TDR38436.1 hypothetical protein DFR29_121108 [Tahibacter aquaticus]